MRKPVVLASQLVLAMQDILVVLQNLIVQLAKRASTSPLLAMMRHAQIALRVIQLLMAFQLVQQVRPSALHVPPDTSV
jgi:hypothetical protein